jgi:hypothetical protein
VKDNTFRGRCWFLYWVRGFSFGMYRYHTCTHYHLGFVGLSVDRK